MNNFFRHIVEGFYYAANIRHFVQIKCLFFEGKTNTLILFKYSNFVKVTQDDESLLEFELGRP